MKPSSHKSRMTRKKYRKAREKKMKLFLKHINIDDMK